MQSPKEAERGSAERKTDERMAENHGGRVKRREKKREKKRKHRILLYS